jgi:hypothetical protein
VNSILTPGGDLICSEEAKLNMRMAAKRRSAKRPPWNKGLKGMKGTKWAEQKTCGVRYRARLDTTPLPVAFKGLNTGTR